MRITYLYLGLAILISACQGNEGESENLKVTEEQGSTQVQSNLSNVDALLATAQNHYLKGELQKAINEFQRVLEIEGNNFAALVSLGNVYYDLGDNHKAVLYYGKALEVDSDNVNIRCDMATCYSRLDMLDTAMFLVRQNIELDYKHIQSHYNLSVFHKRQGNAEEADKEMAIANELKEQHP